MNILPLQVFEAYAIWQKKKNSENFTKIYVANSKCDFQMLCHINCQYFSMK